MNKKQTTITILLILLISLAIFNMEPFRIPEAQATEDWIYGWNYRKSHTINNATAAGTDYQVKIITKYGSGSDSEDTVYLSSHSQTDFDDVRFTKNDGTTLLSYWIETPIYNGINATFWVKISDNLNSSNVMIYVYYGNPNVASGSNGNDTFLFFDDFSGFALNTTKWSAGIYGDFAYYNVSDGNLNIGVEYLDFWHWNNKSAVYVSASSSFKYARFEARVRQTAIVFPIGVPMRWVGMSWGSTPIEWTSFWYLIDVYSWQAFTGDYEGDQVATNLTDPSDELYHKYQITWLPQEVVYYTDDILQANHTTLTAIPSDPQSALFSIYHDAACDAANLTVDWVFLRKIIASDPEHGSWGTEETYQGFYIAYGDEVKIESYENGGSLQALNAHHPSSTGYYSAVTQSFRILTGDHNLTELAFRTKKSGSPTANLTANLYLSSSDKPSGSALSTSLPINSSILTGSLIWYNFTFQGNYLMTNATWYCMETESSTEGTIDDSNYVLFDMHTTEIEGQYGYYANSYWITSSSFDLDFMIYGQKQDYKVDVVTYREYGGVFLTNGTDTSDGEIRSYWLGDVLNLSIPYYWHGILKNFTWNGGSALTNPYYLTLTTNTTIWAYCTEAVFVTFYMNDGTFSVNGSSKSNATEIQYALDTVLTLQGSGFTKYYGFGNWTLSYGGSSGSNPWLHTVIHDTNYSIMLYDKWSPSEWSPDFPTTPAALQYLVLGDYLGFINSVFTSQWGELFYAFIMLVCYVGLYLRLKSIVIPLIAWTLMGGFWIGMAPSVSPFVALFWIIGIGAGVLFSVFSRGSEN